VILILSSTVARFNGLSASYTYILIIHVVITFCPLCNKNPCVNKKQKLNTRYSTGASNREVCRIVTLDGPPEKHVGHDAYTGWAIDGGSTPKVDGPDLTNAPKQETRRRRRRKGGVWRQVRINRYAKYAMAWAPCQGTPWQQKLFFSFQCYFGDCNVVCTSLFKNL